MVQYNTKVGNPAGMGTDDINRAYKKHQEEEKKQAPKKKLKLKKKKSKDNSDG